MRDVVIVDACRTAVGSFGSSLKPLKADALARAVMTAALERTGLEPGQVDEVFLGHCRQSSDCSNTARVAALQAGIPESVPASTVMCACASGMLAVNCGFNAIRTGQDRVVLAGGTESMSNAIFYLSDARWGVGTGNTQLKDSLTEAQFCSQPQDIYGRFNMGITAENIAAKMNISREEQDRFALASQEKARAAIASGRFRDEIVPLTVPQGRKKPDITFDTDEFPRETSMKALSRLKPAFLPPEGTVTAGNSSGRNDGASMLVLMDAQLAGELGLKPLARIVSVASAGVDPRFMGLGPAVAAGVMVVQLQGQIVTQGIQPVVGQLGEQTAAHLTGAGVGDCGLPDDAVVPQTFGQHRQIKGCVMGDEQAAFHDGPDLLPQRLKGRLSCYHLRCDPRQ